MTGVTEKNALGWFGLAVLVLAWVSVFSTPWVGRVWTLRIFAAAALAVLIALVLAIACGRRGSRWWYLLAGISFCSELVLLGDLLAGD